MSQSPSRLFALDYTRAFAIILVVAGHWNPEPRPEWWHIAFNIIYSFHMPLFLAISGYLYMHTRKPGNYLKMLRGKFKRLLIPYFFTSLIIITIKLFTQGNAYVEHPATISTYLKALYYPSAGYFLWFMWALWWMFVVIPLFKTKSSRIVLFIICLVLNAMPWFAPQAFCIAQTLNMMVFFVAGTLLHDWKEWLLPTNDTKIITLLSIIFIGLETGYILGVEIFKLFAAFISILLFPMLFKYLENTISQRWHKWLMTISSTSFIIYLFHTTFLGFVKSTARPLLALNNEWIYGLLIIAATTIGTALPILLAVKILNKFRLTRWMFALK